MTDKTKPLQGTSRTLDEWKEFARRDDCLDQMIPSDLRCILSAIEAVDPATISADALRDKIATKAREYAEHYPQSSDGKNTFLMFAEWVEALALIDKEQGQ